MYSFRKPRVFIFIAISSQTVTAMQVLTRVEQAVLYFKEVAFLAL
jgi:hypothetical protein|tara:strand:- start:341 stop:475 length:135 start_codon:yes stop_codon:yes gene_type:complete